MIKKDVVIHVDNISKLYRIGVKDAMNDSLGKAILSFVKSPLKNYKKYRSLYKFDDIDALDQGRDGESDIIWATRNVSFDVHEGEVLGIVGRNGAGKSTLLKILTRITPPTSGKIEMKGRVSSLLEVGTGFHQELTGRENVYLNGTILGMRKKEVDQKFDEIVDFSGVEKFLDTPVKRYSSGMKVRLAFAVAAHLEPEILLIDEVLAVGDDAFQKKCIKKMKDVGQQGRTVLFVSHNMPAIMSLCTNAILIEEGRLTLQGTPHDVVSAYLKMNADTHAAKEWHDEDTAPGGRVARLRAVKIIAGDGKITESIEAKDEVGIRMVFDVISPDHVLLPHFFLFNDEGITVLGTLDQDPKWYGKPRQKGQYESTVWIPGNYLAEGVFYVTCTLMTRNPEILQFDENQIISFRVLDSMGKGTARGDWSRDFPGVVRPLLDWETKLD